MSDLKITNSQISEPGFSIKLAKLKVEYDTADKLARDVQSFVKKAGIPAINELRYAGHHLLLSLTNPETTSELELDKAIAHCQRASYDASEAGTFVAFKKVDKFKEDYDRVPIVPVLPDWIEILKKCDDAREAIIAARQRGDEQAIDYEKHKAHFAELAEICGRLDRARSELNKIISDRAESGKKSLLTLALSAAGIVAAVVIAFITISLA
ncbi:hypothetical protein WNY39_08960 [Sulfitobacter sp. AS59]